MDNLLSTYPSLDEVNDYLFYQFLLDKEETIKDVLQSYKTGIVTANNLKVGDIIKKIDDVNQRWYYIYYMDENGVAYAKTVPQDDFIVISKYSSNSSSQLYLNYYNPKLIKQYIESIYLTNHPTTHFKTGNGKKLDVYKSVKYYLLQSPIIDTHGYIRIRDDKGYFSDPKFYNVSQLLSNDKYVDLVNDGRVTHKKI